jgi:hypothetical protein
MLFNLYDLYDPQPSGRVKQTSREPIVGHVYGVRHLQGLVCSAFTPNFIVNKTQRRMVVPRAREKPG